MRVIDEKLTSNLSTDLLIKKKKKERNFGKPLSTITNILNNKTDNDIPVKIKMQNTVELQYLTSFQRGYLTDFDPENFKIPTKY
ncbi:hypothetical protein HCN44_005099 [Aphidius gifuensis]|uniref:Uncharacterized protein n=1 Tax=Aphidius gifuensis TaxID=684658 RepID=A0A834XVB8_APHGI|nr:hypothetical protein HCN44_005099 [Aphidius gifuensis]